MHGTNDNATKQTKLTRRARRTMHRSLLDVLAGLDSALGARRE